MPLFYDILFWPSDSEFNLQYCDTLVRIVFVRFLEELKTPKSPFKINWPLATTRAIMCRDKFQSVSYMKSSISSKLLTTLRKNIAIVCQFLEKNMSTLYIKHSLTPNMSNSIKLPNSECCRVHTYLNTLQTFCLPIYFFFEVGNWLSNLKLMIKAKRQQTNKQRWISLRIFFSSAQISPKRWQKLS